MHIIVSVSELNNVNYNCYNVFLLTLQQKLRKMKNYNIERILKPAFKMFLTYNYESVSTFRLEEASGLTRGAIYYKYRSKEEIFKAVIDKYILEAQAQASIIKADSLLDFIEKFIESMKNRMNEIHSLDIKNVHKSYFSLIYQATQYYPGFDRKIANQFKNNLKTWEKVLQSAKENGEIKQSCDIKELAQRFRYTYSGLSFERSILSGVDVEELRALYYSYYNEIKNEK